METLDLSRHTEEDKSPNLISAVYAVFSECGFVGYDPLTGLRLGTLNLHSQSRPLSISLWYTLSDEPPLDVGIEPVVLKFQKLGNFVVVYGSLAKESSSSSSSLHRLCLDSRRFDPNSSSEGDVSGLLKVIVKDALVLPLEIDVCLKAGMGLPPCLMRLPPELKIKVVGLLPGNDIAKMGCVCSEFRNLAMDEGLWKMRVVEDLGDATSVVPEGNQWRERFVHLWERRKRIKIAEERERELELSWGRKVSPIFGKVVYFL